MIGNISLLTSGFNNLVEAARQTYVKVAPESLSKEKRFVNSISVACALVTVSDGKLEVNEILEMSKLLHSLKQVTDLDLHDFAAISYKENTLSLDKILTEDGEAAFELEKQIVLNEIRVIKDDAESVAMLKGLLGVLKNQAGKNKPVEVKMMADILEVLK